jgi:hypothetical protein
MAALLFAALTGIAMQAHAQPQIAAAQARAIITSSQVRLQRGQAHIAPATTSRFAIAPLQRPKRRACPVLDKQPAACILIVQDME